MTPEKRERLPVSVSAAVFIEDDQGRLLLLQQASKSKEHKWGPPAGGMKAHEDPMMAAVRETREEIGVEVELVDLVGIYTVARGDNASGQAYVFRGRVVGGEMAPREGEIANFRFFSTVEIQELIKEGMLYKPEYNIRNVNDWLNGSSYSIEVVKRFE
ncbi:MAG: NUDIX hydrolase [Patescibacteria group bacterium]